VVVERAAHRRLKLVDALRADFQVESVEMLDGVLRTIRTIRPAIVLVGVGRRLQQSTRAVHQIKTDGASPPRVGLMDWDGRISDPAAIAQEAKADGIFYGPPTARELSDFVAALESEECVVMGAPQPRGWKRFLGR
jgi:hypothetical protein